MNTRPSGYNSSSISLPPINTMDLNRSRQLRTAPNEYPQSMPPSTRSLPPLPTQSRMPGMPQPEYVTAARQPYQEPAAYYGYPSSRMPLPSTIDHISIAPSRNIPKTKEVKRRTKTGCMTCRRRRIKCGEERPECRNCVKSKRQCSGYESTYSSQPSPLEYSIPDPIAATAPQGNIQPPPYHQSLDRPSQNSYGSDQFTTSTSQGYPQEYSYYHRNSDPGFSNINPTSMMDYSQQRSTSMNSRCLNTQNMRTIEDICSVNGHRSQPVPPLPASSAPNFGEIQKVYDTFFAPGLDYLLETGDSRWFSVKGFALLASDRSLLAQFMLYLTLISNTANITVANGPEQAVLASQEARMVWALLNLCVRPAQEGSDEEAEIFAHRVKAIEALLTGEPIVRTASMSDFVHQEEADQDVDLNTSIGNSATFGNISINTTDDPNLLLQAHNSNQPFNLANQQSLFQKQLSARSDNFWSLVAKAAAHPTSISIDLFEQTRHLLDGKESRDVIYSAMLLTSKTTTGPSFQGTDNNGSNNGTGGAVGSRPGTASGGADSNNSSPNRAARRQEREQASRLLESQAGGKATNLVLQVLAGMALRAFQ